METTQSSFPDERAVIEKVLAGEKQAFAHLVRATNPALYKIGRLYGFNHQQTEDLMQDAHLSAYRNLSSFEFRASYKTWISRIMIHECQYRLKHGAGRWERPLSEAIRESDHPVHANSRATETLTSRGELSRIILSTLETIPPAYRTALVLRYMEGYSTRETAEMLGVSLVNVKVRLLRARAMVKGKLENRYDRLELYPFDARYCTPLTERIMEALGITPPR